MTPEGHGAVALRKLHAAAYAMPALQENTPSSAVNIDFSQH